MLEFMDKYARIPDLILYLSVIMTSLSFSIFHTFHKFLSLANPTQSHIGQVYSFLLLCNKLRQS